jgi:uncharacterized membrane protein
MIQIFLTIFSAFLHPLRDFILKNEKDNRDALYILMLLFWSLYGGILTIILNHSFSISGYTLFLCLISSVGNLIYFASIARALKNGEFSVLYPIIRSTPFLIAFFKWAFFGFSYKPLFIFGILLVVYGVISIQSGFVFWKNIEEIKNNKNNIFYAIFALIGGVIYYVVDDIAMSSGQISPNAYLFYNFSICGFLFLFILLFKGGLKKELTVLKHIMKHNWYKPALAGLTGFISYFCIVTAISLGGNVVLISALRLWGIPFAVILGVFYLKEKKNLQRKIIAILIIFIGSIIATINK